MQKQIQFSYWLLALQFHLSILLSYHAVKDQMNSPTRLSSNNKAKESKLNECTSAEQFFKVKPKKKNYVLNISKETSPRQSFFENIRNRPANNPQIESNKLLKIEQLTTNTESTLDQGNISFKSKKSRRKVNKAQSPNPTKIKSQKLKKINEGSVYNPDLLSQNIVPKLKESEPILGKKLKDFLILKRIGEGNFSQVLLAIQKNISFLCCLKKMEKKLILEKNMVHVLIREIKIHFYLKHSNIVDMYGMFEDGPHIYLIVEYCTNGDLFHYLKKKRRSGHELTSKETASLIRQLSLAVQSMHNDYVMHRDIKPENIFLTMGDVMKLGDLGCSVCYSNSQLRNTQCGTPLYLAPQLIGKGQYSESVDIWAIGVLAYELLSGYSPFTIRSSRDISKVLKQDIDFQYIDDEQGKDFVMKLLQKNVEKRYEIEDVLEHQFLQQNNQDVEFLSIN